MTLSDLDRVLYTSTLLKVDVYILDNDAEYHCYICDLTDLILNREIYSINNLDIKNGYIDVTLE